VGLRSRDFEPELTKEIIQRYEDGERVAAISADIASRGREVTIGDVYQVLRDAGVPRTQRRGPYAPELPGIEGFVARYGNGEPVTVLAAEVGVSFGVMRDRLVKAGAQIRSTGRTRTEIPNLEDLIRRCADGASIRSLALEVGVNPNTLKKLLEELNGRAEQ
jgi:hypothetical protein